MPTTPPSKKSSASEAFDPEQWAPETQLVHGGIVRSQFGETSEALFLTQGFVYDSAEQAAARFTGDSPGYQYSRFGNPTVAMFEERMRLLEGADACRATATGMAAVTASLLCYLNAGDHIVAARAMFGSCRYVIETLCPRFGIQATLVDGREPANWAAAVRPNTRAFFFESPANPTLELVDIAAVATIAHDAGAILIVDNVFATPLLQHPLELGADVVVYSATKHIDGQGRCLGGAVLGSDAYVRDHLHDFLRQTGPSLSPFNAWILLKGLETLSLRVHAQTQTAAAIAGQLAAHGCVARVLYPYHDSHPQVALGRRQMKAGGTLVTFDIKGGRAEAFRFLNSLKIIQISNNLGDAKSLITHPATTTHQRLTPDARAELGISETTLRLSLGLEAGADLQRDLAQALAAAG